MSHSTSGLEGGNIHPIQSAASTSILVNDPSALSIMPVRRFD